MEIQWKFNANLMQIQWKFNGNLARGNGLLADGVSTDQLLQPPGAGGRRLLSALP